MLYPLSFLDFVSVHTSGKEKANTSPTIKTRVGFAFVPNGGEKGIRTLGTLSTYTRFPVVRLRPAQPSLQTRFSITDSRGLSIYLFTPPARSLRRRNTNALRFAAVLGNPRALCLPWRKFVPWWFYGIIWLPNANGVFALRQKLCLRVALRAFGATAGGALFKRQNNIQ